MKFKIGAFVIMMLNLNILSIGQSSNLNTSFSNESANFDCQYCFYGDFDYKTGIKFGFGYGVVKKLNERIELVGNLNFNYWRYEIDTKIVHPIIPQLEKEENAYFALSAGERINLFVFENSKIYTGVNLNVQLYLYSRHRLYGFGMEPNIGWSKMINSNHEFNAFVGYDQHLMSYNRRYNRKPGKLSLSIGWNYVMK